MRDIPRENFRWAAHTGGLAILKPKDYELGEEISAANPYECWRTALARGTPLRPGDVLQVIENPELGLQSSAGELFVTKYIGFEPAQWFVPEPKPNELTALDASIPETCGTTETLSL